jgi:hypothetical protein
VQIGYINKKTQYGVRQLYICGEILWADLELYLKFRENFETVIEKDSLFY